MNLTSQGSACGDRGPCLASVALHTLFDVGTLTGLTDGQLLDRFARGGHEGAEAAFAPFGGSARPHGAEGVSRRAG